MPVSKFLFRRCRARSQQFGRLPSQMALQRGQIFKRSHFAEFAPLAQILQIEKSRRQFQRPARRRRFPVGSLRRRKFEPAVEHSVGVQRLAQLQHRGPRQPRMRPQPEAPVRLLAILPVERQRRFRRRLAHRLRHALADPIQIRRIRQVKKRKNQERTGRPRARHRANERNE